MCGRGGAAGNAIQTSRQGCGECTSRQLQRKVATGPRVVRRQVEKKIRSPKVRRQRSKNFKNRLSGFVNREEKQRDIAWYGGRLEHGSGGGVRER